MKNYTSTGLIRLTAVCLVFAVILSSSMFVLAAPGTKSLSAELIVSGANDNGVPAVTLNGEEATTGRTFQTSGIVSTAAHGSAVINLGKLGRINLDPGSTLSLTLSENNISGTLSAGHYRVLNAEGVSVNITTPEGMAVPQTKDDDDDDDDKGAWIPVLIFAGVVATAVVLVVTRDGEETTVVSPVR
jgi:hypothetical protein